MVDKSNTKNLCSRLLTAYGINTSVDASDIKELKIYKSRLFGFCSVYSFSYKNRNFLVSDDYSLMDDLNYIKAVLEDATELSNGKLVENPKPQSDGAKYALGLNETEYYLWECSLD
ncbi:MAG: hypothetical protein WBP26_04925 [Candidatus Saccharimonadales bacterium]